MEPKDQPHTGLLRTLGDQAGENQDMSDSPETKLLVQVSAVSKKLPHTQPFENALQSLLILDLIPIKPLYKTLFLSIPFYFW